MTLHPIPLNFLIYEENFIFFFYQLLERTKFMALCVCLLTEGLLILWGGRLFVYVEMWRYCLLCVHDSRRLRNRDK
jgi:hypothetical protein